MTELVLNWGRAMWGKEALRQKIENLQEKYSRSLAFIKTIVEVNKQQAAAIANLERSDRELRAYIDAVMRDSRVIDPNAKCPACGHCKGHLTHVVQSNEVRCVNNCDVCGFSFVSAEPIAGAEAAAAAYQAPLGNERAQLKG